MGNGHPYSEMLNTKGKKVGSFRPRKGFERHVREAGILSFARGQKPVLLKVVL
jgi:hypothetical protein